MTMAFGLRCSPAQSVSLGQQGRLREATIWTLEGHTPVGAQAPASTLGSPQLTQEAFPCPGLLNETGEMTC